ncbi:MAG: L,D-transpeptidase [Pseudolabrys sp.]|nr:L,D-transpeptidase [Pseudolabrys sp.]
MNTNFSRSLAAAAVFGVLAFAAPANAQVLLASTVPQPAVSVMTQDDEDAATAPMRPELQRQIVAYRTSEAPGTIVIDTPNTFLYYVLGNGQAVRYGIGVGREGFTWSGVKTVARKAEWPDWYPPSEMIARQPYLPRMTAGGPGNPLGARAMYLGGTVYRIHGTNNPATIGHQVSSGCIRLTNDDVTDLYSRVKVGTRVVVLPQTRQAPASVAQAYAPAQQSAAQQTWATIRPAGVY